MSEKQIIMSDLYHLNRCCWVLLLLYCTGPANTRHWPNVVLLLVHWLRHGPSIGPPPIPSKHEAMTQCCFNVGPPSSTSAQHENKTGLLRQVSWDPTAILFAWYLTEFQKTSQSPGYTQQAGGWPNTGSMLAQCWAIITDVGPTLSQHCFVSVHCFLPVFIVFLSHNIFIAQIQDDSTCIHWKVSAVRHKGWTGWSGSKSYFNFN